MPGSSVADKPLHAPASALGANDTRIEIDDTEGLIRFYVQGREAARLDADGLVVRDDFSFGGTATDIGNTGYPASPQNNSEGAIEE